MERLTTEMRIAIVHSFYRTSSTNGEDIAVVDQAAAMERAGHTVHIFARRSDDFVGQITFALRSGMTVASGRGPSPMSELRAYRPDVVHVHNTFPNYGRTWVSQLPFPLVVTMHQFRPFCARGTFYRDGRICTSCVDASWTAGVRHACYESSRIKTIPYAMATKGSADDPLLSRADVVVALSQTVRRLLIEKGGVDSKKVLLGGNYVEDLGGPGPGGAGWLYAGRLHESKGICELLERWPKDVVLTVVGDGPQRSAAQRIAGSNVRFLGLVERQRLRTLMFEMSGLIFPSRWYEFFPLVYPEALSAGLPVLAFRPSSVAEMVAADGTGGVTGWEEDLHETVRTATTQFRLLRDQVREVYEAKYSESAFVISLEQVYAAAMSNFQARIDQ